MRRQGAEQLSILVLAQVIGVAMSQLERWNNRLPVYVTYDCSDRKAAAFDSMSVEWPQPPFTTEASCPYVFPPFNQRLIEKLMLLFEAQQLVQVVVVLPYYPQAWWSQLREWLVEWPKSYECNENTLDRPKCYDLVDLPQQQWWTSADQNLLIAMNISPSRAATMGAGFREKARRILGRLTSGQRIEHLVNILCRNGDDSTTPSSRNMARLRSLSMTLLSAEWLKESTCR